MKNRPSPAKSVIKACKRFDPETGRKPEKWLPTGGRLL
jgi:hypothetical protein